MTFVIWYQTGYLPQVSHTDTYGMLAETTHSHTTERLTHTHCKLNYLAVYTELQKHNYIYIIENFQRAQTGTGDFLYTNPQLVPQGCQGLG